MRTTIPITFNNVQPGYRALVIAAVEDMGQVVSSTTFQQCLKEEIDKSYSLCGERSKWKNATADEIYKQLFPITLQIKTYYSLRNVIGYGLPNDPWIHLNTRYLDKRELFDDESLMLIGSNLLHEHGHDVGFDHDFYDTQERKYSICYILNRAYERAFRIIYKLPEPKPAVYPWYVKAWWKIKGIFA